MHGKTPKLLVFCSLFPNSTQPNAGVFIRERMFRVGRHCPIVVVSPIPWFPFQGVLRRVKPGFRPQPDNYEEQQGVKIYYPRFFSIPGLLKHFDGFFMALSCLVTLYKIRRFHAFDIIDAHFAYPDGYAAVLLGKWFKVPVTITLRGTEVPLSKMSGRRKRIVKALTKAVKVFSVADSLKRHAMSLGISAEKIEVVGNGVDIEKFFPVPKTEARRELGLADDAKVLISVGGLVDRKGYHRVIEIMPELVRNFPELIYIIVGGACAEGNNRAYLEQMVERLGLERHVRFLGALPSEQLKTPLSAADVFVLATANEGWANVFLEAMACGLPVVTTDVGGNREVVCNDSLGIVVPFGDAGRLQGAVNSALGKQWDNQEIINYAAANTWDLRVQQLTKVFFELID
ncbi:MAG: glycosyltransferase [Gammaproteobacteria bacterium]